MASSQGLALLVCVAVGLLPGAFSSGWRIGRVTNYGDHSTGDPASFHSGSCGYGSLWGKVDNLNVMAIPNTHPDFEYSCGACYEVKCHPMKYKDNYGNIHDRESSCYDPHKVVTFTVVDCCPCNSNRQWCCGDMDHFDLSFWGFSELAARHWGTIGIKYRKVNKRFQQWRGNKNSTQDYEWCKESMHSFLGLPEFGEELIYISRNGWGNCQTMVWGVNQNALRIQLE